MGFKEELNLHRNPEIVKQEAEIQMAKKANGGVTGKMFGSLHQTLGQMVTSIEVSDSLGDKNAEIASKEVVGARRQDLEARAEDIKSKASDIENSAENAFELGM